MILDYVLLNQIKTKQKDRSNTKRSSLKRKDTTYDVEDFGL